MVATMLLVARLSMHFQIFLWVRSWTGKSPKGKCRPWFIRMAIPVFVMIVLLFTVPRMQAAGTGIRINHKYIDHSSCLHSNYYGALMAMRTESSEGGKMGIFRAAFGYLAGMIIAIL
ncbi:MAG: hypothetical protein ACLVB1_03525 [Blautia obeum]